MSDKNRNCTNCFFAVWQKTSSGRNKFAQGGKCRKEVVIPNSYANPYGDLPNKRLISKYTNPNCLCWEKKGGKNAVNRGKFN